MYHSDILEQKCLKVAIQQIKDARTKERANYIYTAWKVFHTNQEFMKAIENKKVEFNNKINERNGIASKRKNEK